MRERLIAFNLCHLTLLAIFSVLGFAQDFKPYPGSRLDEKASQQSSAVEKGMEVQVYTSSDNFEKVYSFYKSLYKEVAVPFPKQTLPSGRDVKWAFFVLDGTKDLMHSKYWMKVQHPYVGTVDDEANFEDVRDVSVIQTVRRRSPAFKKSSLLDVSDKREHQLGGTAVIHGN